MNLLKCKSVFFLLFASVPLIEAQIQLSDSLANYYYYVNQAELMLADGNLLGADFKYSKADQEKQNRHGRDLYNRALLKIKLNKTKAVYPLLEQLAAKGFNLKLLLKKESFRQYFATKKGEKQWERLKTVEPSYDVALRAQYDSLFVEDSLAHENYNPDRFNMAVGKLDSQNIALFIRLVEKHGFPSEALIGIHEWFDYEMVLAIIRHHTKHNQIEERVNLLPYLEKAISEGAIPNYAVADFMSKSYFGSQLKLAGDIVKLRLLDTSGVCIDSAYTNYVVKVTTEYDEYHRSIGLPSVEECLKLSKFNWENQTEFILGTAERKVFNFKRKGGWDTLNRMRNRVEIIEY